jgi:peptidoglycan/LPS O-acetylase OafA/YrhL
MPALWLFLFFWVMLALLHGGGNERNHLLAALSAGLYFMNWTRAFDMGPSDLLGHTWSLAVEEQFYLLWPPLLFSALRKLDRSLVWAPILLMLVASAGWRAFLVYSGAEPDRVYNGFDTRAETLLFGCLLAALPTDRFASINRRFWFVPLCSLLLCLFFLPETDNWNPGEHWKAVFTLGFSMIAVCAAWVIVLICQYRSVLRIPVLSWRPVVYLGRISYGIYLWHYPINIVLSARVSESLNFALTSAVSVLIASASYHLIEARALRLKSRFNSGYRRTVPVEEATLAL